MTLCTYTCINAAAILDGRAVKNRHFDLPLHLSSCIFIEVVAILVVDGFHNFKKIYLITQKLCLIMCYIYVHVQEFVGVFFQNMLLVPCKY